jgi:hypothetical protein
MGLTACLLGSRRPHRCVLGTLCTSCVHAVGAVVDQVGSYCELEGTLQPTACNQSAKPLNRLLCAPTPCRSRGSVRRMCGPSFPPGSAPTAPCWALWATLSPGRCGLTPLQPIAEPGQVLQRSPSSSCVTGSKLIICCILPLPCTAADAAACGGKFRQLGGPRRPAGAAAAAHHTAARPGWHQRPDFSS